MSSRVKQRKSDRIDRLVAHLQERWDGNPTEALVSFLRLYYRGAPAADLLETPIETLYGAALSAWRFAERWIPGRAKVRVYNPSLEEHGWHSPHTVIEVVNDDMPFLVDSVTSELLDRDVQVQQIVHPVYDVLRDEGGEIVALGEQARGRSGARRESFIQLQVHAQPKETYDALQTALAQVLAHVRASVLDWTAMMAACRDTASLLRDSGAAQPGGDAQESADFLDWLCDDNFTFLGFRTVRFEGIGDATTGRVVPDSGLGMLRDPALQLFDGMLTRKTLPPEVHHFLGEVQAIKIVKANLHSPVHRPVLLDIIAVKERDDAGHVVNSHLIVGLFTSKAYAATPMDVPILRWKVTRTLSQAEVPQQTHDGRALMHILNTYPRDALFEISEEELVPTVLGILDLQQRPRTALFVRIDPFERAVSCLVFAPRDLYDTALRRRYQDMLIQAWQGELAAFSTHVDESHLARLHLTIKTTPENLPDVDVQALENALAELGRSWGDRLEAALVEEHGEERGVMLHRRYQDAFPPAYRDLFNEPEAVADIGHVENALENDGLALNLYRPLEADANVLRFKVYAVGPLASLSELVPMLENTGFRVLAEEPYRVRAKGIERPVWIRDLVLETLDGSSVDLAHVRHRFHDTFRQVWQGDIDNDGFNRLVLKAGLGVREISVLRAYCRFLLQARIPFSQAYIEQTLASQPEIARRLVELFCTRFDPSCREGAEAREAELSSQIKALLNEVSNLDMDRIIRRYLEAIRLTLRTNHFQSGADGGPKPYLSFKLASSEMSTLVLPRPYREIFVFGPRVEAVHLRGGKVARGGLRWSDRPEDFRTEILGLMKAQMVKNTVIVPVGSKGGFVVRRLPPAEAGRDAVMAEVIEAYRTMIRGLLDLTDNIEGDRTVPPENVVRHDDDDPYLVVAADKGTATFSDIANGVSRDYGFWLDDAFASGGSAGYDHKKMAITARGAWECVRRHFREIGKDIQTQDFSVVGVGDMGGDVFGNGMLLSEHIRLLGAFNHLHIFLDPTPDAGASYQERKRLFELPRSTWADYDPALMSQGGGVFERTLKSIPISPQVQKALRIQADELTPNELIHAMLQAPVELMWFGGIGTYVKASDETHAEADDRANDAVRIDAAKLGAKVVGEGANLALTQRGRVQAGLRGVRLNTDALDNSAGVDCSDHEVNIKILLGEVERAGDLTRKRRDLLLEEMTDEVGDLVLRDNYLQSQAITVAHAKATASLDRLGRFMRTLEKAGLLDRVIEFLPDDETLALRLKERLGLTRPELSVLLSYAKLVLYDELLSTTLPDEPWMADEVVRYFPDPLRVSYEAEIGRHSLRREIAATVLTNAILNRVGITFVREMNERTGFPADDIARAYIAARDVLGLPSLWRDIEALDNQIPAALQTEMLIETTKTVEQVVAWMLRELPRPLDVPVIVLTYREGVRLLGENLGELLPASHQIAYAGQTQSLTARGAPEAIANRVVGLEALAPGCDIVRIAMAADISVQRAAAVYYGVGEAYGFDWLQRATAEIPQDSAWDKIAVQAVVDDLYGHQGAIAARVLEDATEDDVRATALIERWNEGRGSLVERTKHLFAELSATPRPDLAMVTVAVRQMKALSS